MKNVIPLLSLCLLAVGCGGASDDGGRKAGTVNSDADGGAGEADDDTGEGAGGDDDGSGTGADDDVGGDDDLPVMMGDDEPSVPASPGTTTPATPPSMPVNPPITPTPVPVTPVVPTPGEPLTGCTIVGQSTSAGYCEINQQCENGYSYSYCNQRADGTWACGCNDSYTSQEFAVANSDSPCGLIAEVCGKVETPSFDGEATCSIEYQASSVDYCELQERCAKFEPINDQVNIVQAAYNYSSCYTDGAGGLSCSCSGVNSAKNFTLTSVTTPAACEVGKNICAGVEVALSPEETCTVTYESAAVNYCERQQSCGQTATVDGTEVQLTESEYASCQSDNAGGSICSCSNNSRSYSFGLDAPTSDSATCISAIDVCDATELPAPEGEIECAQRSQSSSLSYCDASILCTQNATVNGTVIGLQGNIYASCQPNGDTWSCQCQSNTATAILSVTVDGTLGAACAEAVLQCPDLVDPAIGSSGGVSPPCGGIAFNAAADVAIAPAPGGAVAIPVPCAR